MTDYPILNTIITSVIAVPGTVWAMKTMLGTRIVKSIETQFTIQVEKVKSDLNQQVLTELERIRTDNQRHLQRELELVRTSLQREQQIHVVQFQSEFTVYKELWTKIDALACAVESLLPVVDYSPPEGVTWEDMMKQRLQLVGKTFNEVKRCVHANKPFYSESVYEASKPLLKTAIEGFTAIQLTVMYRERRIERAGLDEYQKMEQICKELTQHIDGLEKVIRQRIYPSVPMPRVEPASTDLAKAG